jgi:DNA invertase Pin-like site-specific DNA recombinase
MTPHSKSNGGHMAPATTGRIVGYARVSTDGQSLDGQFHTLKAAGAASIFRETASGARSDRPQLQRLLVRLTPGDVLLVTRLDRLARSTRDLLNVLDTVAKAGASFRSIGDAWCDTTTPHGRLMLTVLGGLAEFERELIRERTGEGRKRAMAAGVRFGRPRKLTTLQTAEIVKRKQAGEPLSTLAQLFRVSVSTVARVTP